MDKPYLGKESPLWHGVKHPVLFVVDVVDTRADSYFRGDPVICTQVNDEIVGKPCIRTTMKIGVIQSAELLAAVTGHHRAVELIGCTVSDYRAGSPHRDSGLTFAGRINVTG